MKFVRVIEQWVISECVRKEYPVRRSTARATIWRIGRQKKAQFQNTIHRPLAKGVALRALKECWLNYLSSSSIIRVQSLEEVRSIVVRSGRSFVQCQRKPLGNPYHKNGNKGRSDTYSEPVAILQGLALDRNVYSRLGDMKNVPEGLGNGERHIAREMHGN